MDSNIGVEMNFVKHISSVEILPTLPSEILTKIEQKKQPSNRLRQMVRVTVKQPNQEVMSEKAGTRSFALT
jgi:hypothetical protein